MRRGSKATLAVLTAVAVNLALLPGAGTAAGRRSATEIAIDHLQKHPGRYGVTAADVQSLEVTDAYRSEHNGVTHVYLRQQVGGLPVLGSSATVNVTPDGHILLAGARLVGGLGEASGARRVGPVDAVAAAARELGLRPSSALAVIGSRDDAVLVSPAGIALSAIPVRPAYQAVPDGRIRLAWNVEIEERSQQHWWNVSIDAENGELLVTDDYADHDSVEATASALARPERSGSVKTAGAGVPDGSSYRVFALPFESPNDGPRTLVQNPADAIASPFGWHDTNGAAGAEFTTTEGNNAHAYIDTFNAGMGVPLVTDASGGSGLDFDFIYDPTLPPTAYKDAAVTNLFYWNNIIHDVFYRYGFDEVSGNFQVNNYGRGGAGNDSARAEAQDGSGTNNANFFTPADGSRPRMQMYLWTTTLTANRQLIDGDFDSGVITHEYGHGISNRLTGGPSNAGCLGHQEREGEGWSDWLALALTTLPGENGATPRGMGPFVLGQANRQGAGIRPTRYSTNMSVNGSTYDDIKTLAVPHGVGYVWATMLWEVYWDLIAKHGYNPNVYADWTTGGNNLAIQLVMDGMKMQPCSPGFVDARNGVLAADVALTGGDNQCLIWRGFAKRGLGYSASQGSPSSRSDGAEAFDTHPDCRAALTLAPAGITGTAPPGGTAQATLTIGNGAGVDGHALDWSIAEAATDCATPADLDWVGVDPRFGTTTAGGATEVAVTLDAGLLPSGATRDAVLCVSSNGAGTAPVEVPVRLDVT